MADDTLLGGQGNTDTNPDGAQPIIDDGNTTPIQPEPTGTPQVPTVPESYDFSEAVGENLDAEVAASFSDVLKSIGATQAQAAAIAKYGVGYAEQVAQQAVAYQQEQAAKQSNEWAQQTKQELGASYDDTLAQCGAAVEYLECEIPNIREIINENGLGNRVEVVKMFAKIGQLVAEDRGIGSNGVGGTETAADILYGGSK